MTIRSAPPKDPAAILDYTRTWDKWLQSGETITVSTWAIAGDDVALTLGTGGRAATNDTTTATCWLLGGTVGVTYTVTNHIVTNASPAREDERSFEITITDL